MFVYVKMQRREFTLKLEPFDQFIVNRWFNAETTNFVCLWFYFEEHLLKYILILFKRFDSPDNRRM